MNQSSLLDGIDIAKPAPRKTIDAAWTKQRKTIVGAAVAVLGVGVLGFGAYSYWKNLPPSLPTNVDQAIALISSNKIDTLAPDRQEQYLDAAAELLKDLPDEERRKLFRDDKSREALERIREQQFDEIARKFAKGEDLDWRNMRGPGMGPGGPGREGGPPPGGNPDGGGAGGGGGRDGAGGGGGGRNGGGQNRGNPDARRAMMDQRMARSLNSGNAQSVGLRGEMMKRMQQQRQQGGNPGPR